MRSIRQFLRVCGPRRPSREIARLEQLVTRLSEEVSAIERVHWADLSSSTESVRYYSTKHLTPLSLYTIIHSCSNAEYKPARFMRREVPIRLAHCWISLGSLPAGLPYIPSIIQARRRLQEVFTAVIDSPPWSDSSDTFDEQKFRELMKQVQVVLSDAHILTASGVKEFRDEANRRTSLELSTRNLDTAAPSGGGSSLRDDPLIRLSVASDVFPLIQEKLDEFNRVRISLSFLVGQFISLPTTCSDDSGSNQTPEEGQVGLVSMKTPLGAVANEAVEEVEGMCIANYGMAPTVEVTGDVDTIIPHVPTHIRYVLVELLKNAFRAVVERHGLGKDAVDELPTVRVRVVESTDEVAIIISDKGGGIPRNDQRRIWSYLYTTADDAHADGGAATPRGQGALAGFGYGLPISRLYARAFGGKLRLYSMEGVGTDVYFHLQRDAVAAGEVQPSSPDEIAAGTDPVSL